MTPSSDPVLKLDDHDNRFGYSFERQFSDAEAWEATTGQQLERISDWNVPAGCVETPDELILEAFRQTLAETTHYSETSRLIICSEEICDSIVRTYAIEMPPNRGVHLFGNATQAILGVAYALSEILPLPRMVLCHPSYYSIQDAARLCGIETWGVFRTMAAGFRFDFSLLRRVIRNKGANILCITEPIYSVGLPIGEDEWTALVDFCASENIWLVIDGAFGGLSWSPDTSAWLPSDRLSTKYEKLILIDAPSKRLFVNNVKFGLVIACGAIIDQLRNFTDWHLGNITGLQIHFASCVFSADNRPRMEEICRSNARTAMRNYDLLATALDGSPHAWTFRPRAGFYTTVYMRGTLLRGLNVMDACRAWIRKYQTLVIPNADFFAAETDEFGIRVNLVRPTSTWLEIVRNVASKGMPS